MLRDGRERGDRTQGTLYGPSQVHGRRARGSYGLGGFGHAAVRRTFARMRVRPQRKRGSARQPDSRSPTNGERLYGVYDHLPVCRFLDPELAGQQALVHIAEDHAVARPRKLDRFRQAVQPELV